MTAKEITDALLEAEDEYDPKEIIRNHRPPPKPFGYIRRGKYTGQWLNSHMQICNDIRCASVYPVHSKKEHDRTFSNVELVPVYSDPQKTGTIALNPYPYCYFCFNGTDGALWDGKPICAKCDAEMAI